MEDTKMSKLLEFNEKRKLFVNSEGINKRRCKESISAIDSLKIAYEKEFTRAEVAEKAYEDLYTNISRYSNEFEERLFLGEGAYGKVYLCRHRLDKCEYAVKRVRFVGSGAILMTEVYALAKLKHDGIIRYYNSWVEVDDVSSDSNVRIIPYRMNEAEAKAEDDFDYEDESAICYFRMDQSETSAPMYLSLFIQMELCKRTLNAALVTTGIPIDYDTGREYFRQIVEAVLYMHQQGIIHKDLGSTNIFLDNSSKIKIADFGIAKVGDEDLHPRSPGLPIYSAPERRNVGVEIDAKADIYSLGIILFELISNITSYTHRAVILESLIEHRVFPEEINSRDKEFIIRLLSELPADRPSAEEILAWLKQ